MPDQPERPLAGKTILIVEDMFIIADELRAIVENAGATVVSSTRTAAGALDWLSAPDQRVDGVLLDVNLPDAKDGSVADHLTKRGIPFVVVTGYEPATLPPEFLRGVVVTKPFEAQTLLEIAAEAFKPRGRKAA